MASHKETGAKGNYLSAGNILNSKRRYLIKHGRASLIIRRYSVVEACARARIA